MCVIGLRATRQNIMGLLAINGFANILADSEKCASLLKGAIELVAGTVCALGFHSFCY